MKDIKRAKRLTLGALIVLLLLLCDQISKLFADFLQVAQQKYFLGIIRLSYSPNYGMAFGIFNDNAVAMYIITGITAVLILGIAALYATVFRKNLAAQIALAFVEAGAIGNFIDRICLGYVRDFLDVSPTGFGICNVADFCITGGAVALIVILLFIGPASAFPLKKSWREQAQREEEEKHGAA